MKKVRQIKTTYKDTKNEDLKIEVRYPETEKTFAEIDTEINQRGATLELYEGENKLDLENMSLKDYRRLASLYVKELTIMIEDEIINSSSVRKLHKYIVVLPLVK